MDTISDIVILNRILEPITRCLTPEAAEELSKLRADHATQARLDELAAKSNDGTLTDTERHEYATYIDALDLLGILQAKARARLGLQPDE